ncbi:prolyl oligopeptidase family serine peptidase [Oleiagrimonas sp. C23AA]|uniref:prolyl oligopeptidase family serine peptidase n=1 Tax=Oleiagrimonas sp. C23AA TaxID=2719047 RepID=UPI00142319CF|nr:prolyl oligopeptidase family serine peptidase [Oleiagrimonas sp. C23AA]NII11326.1 S9 family peptidase [Oleiagrimonas sp. C23AA]
MRHVRSLLAMACTLAAAPVLAATVPPPASPRHDVTDVIHGTTVHDPYRWLENAGNPKVQAWIAKQNAHTESVIGAMPAGKVLTKRVRELAVTSTTRSSPLLAGGTLFYMRETPPQPQPVLVAQGWPHGKTRVLVDLNKDGGSVAITGYWPSPHGRYLAYGTAKGGSELTTLHVLDVKTGKTLSDTLPWAGGGTTPQAVAWDANAHGFTYVRFAPPPKGHEVKQFNATLVHHVLGHAASSDRVTFGKGYSHVAEYRLLSSPGARHQAVLANIGDGGPADVFVKHGAHYRRVLGHDANVREAAWIGQKLVVVAFKDAPRGQLLSVDADGRTQVLLGQRDGAIQSVAPLGQGFVVTYSSGPDWWAEQFDAQGKAVRHVPLPAHGISIGGIASEHGSDEALITYGGWTLPSRWAEYDARNGKLHTVFEVKPASDTYDKIEVSRISGTSRDGTRIPVTVLSMPGVDANGKRPTILYSYGGFDIPIRPGFIGARLAWLEHGGVLAFANIRGGNEDGEAWHRQGMGEHKQNVFDDFFAAAQALENEHWTDPAHLGILGGSNGGLLMGAELTQHPRAFRAVVAEVGIYDMLRHETAFANGQYNVSEYGSIADPAQFKATYAYSPYYNVKKGTAYPAVLMTTGANDPRVAPWQSRKFTAALQWASSSKQPILLLTRMNAGHGVGAPFSQRVGNTVLSLTFFAHELGLDVK